MTKSQEAGTLTAQVCRKHGISSASFYKYKAKFGGMEVSNVRKLKALEEENAKLKKLLTETMLDNAILKDAAVKKMVTPDARRNAVIHVCQEHTMRQRRACTILCIDRSSVHYRRKRPDDALLREAIKQLLSKRSRFG